MKIKLYTLAIAAFSLLTMLMMNGCQSTPTTTPPAPGAISCAFNPPGGISCTGARPTFQATGTANSKLKIVGIAAVATGPNSDCAQATIIGDSDTRSNVIDTGVNVTCDCGSGQTVHVVISVMDDAGNVCDATCTLTTP